MLAPRRIVLSTSKNAAAVRSGGTVSSPESSPSPVAPARARSGTNGGSTSTYRRVTTRDEPHSPFGRTSTRGGTVVLVAAWWGFVGGAALLVGALAGIYLPTS